MAFHFLSRLPKNVFSPPVFYLPVLLFLVLNNVRVSGQDCILNAINISGPGIGSWTAPETGGPWLIQVTAVGGAGGDQGGGNNFGGQGAQIIATFEVNNNESILAIAGGAGGSGDVSDAGGGGGGSGAVNCGVLANCASGTILVIAAGGNGGEGQGNGNGGSASLGSAGAGGAGGGVDGGGGGGGMLSAGTAGALNGGTGGARVSSFNLVSGGLGTDGSNDGGEGMGGGGGGGAGNNTGAGGGGGRSGAAGGNVNSATSFVHSSASNIQGTDGLAGGGPTPGSVILDCLGSLPVRFLHFKANVLGEVVKLVWSTASEQNNHGYQVERSADNRDWTSLGFVPGNGTTAEKHEYGFTDPEPLAGVNYYRLKQMDTDGKHEYTPIVVADLHTRALQFEAFPNPAPGGRLSLRAVSQQEGDAVLEIFDWSGQKVRSETIRLWKGTTIWPIALTELPKGSYTARLQTSEGASHFKKILVQ